LKRFPTSLYSSLLFTRFRHSVTYPVLREGVLLLWGASKRNEGESSRKKTHRTQQNASINRSVTGALATGKKPECPVFAARPMSFLALPRLVRVGVMSDSLHIRLGRPISYMV
jgi:hypothetical protein